WEAGLNRRTGGRASGPSRPAAQPLAAPAGAAVTVTGRWIRRTRSTAAPGRLETSTSAPYTTAVATPWAAVSPAAPNAHAATPSRGPNPATFAGNPMARRASNVSGTSRDSGAVEPAVRAAIRNVARWADTTATDAATTGNAERRASSPSRRSALAVRSARTHRCC